jgi:AcrR family transcriptional regulator
MSFVEKVVIDNNVDAAHNAVNGNILDRVGFVSEKSYHHGNLRTALLEQAQATVREQGVDSLSLRDLARQVGVSHGAPRRHFQDRQALVDALAESGFEQLGAELTDAFEQAGSDFGTRLRASAAAYLRFAINDAALLDLMFSSKGHDADDPLHTAAMEAFAPMFELIHQGQREGILEAGDPERIGLVLFASIQGTAALFTSGMIESVQLEQLASDAITYFVRGALPNPARMSA